MGKTITALSTLACAALILTGCSPTPTTGATDGTKPENSQTQPATATPPVIEGPFLFGDGIERGVNFGRYQWVAVTLQDDGTYDPPDEDEPIMGIYKISEEPNENGRYVLTLLDEDGGLDADQCATTQPDMCDEPDTVQKVGDTQANCAENCDVPDFNELYINQYEITVTEGNPEMPDEFTLTPVLSERDKLQLEYEPWTTDNGGRIYNYEWGCGWQYGYHYYHGNDEPDPVEDCVIDTDTWTWANPSVGTFRRK